MTTTGAPAGPSLHGWLRLARAMAALLLCVSGVSAATGAGPERILNFDSRIVVDADGSMVVTETIRVLSTGEQIRRGIYRDFPTTYRDHVGRRTTIDFAVVAVAREDQPEAWHTENLSNGVRVYIGRKDALLPPGEHTYTLSYRTDRQIGFFKDHDELYWNVTGNGWAFAIDRATALVELPQGVADISPMEAYTGPAGAQRRDYTVEELSERMVVFTTTRPLAPAEGLTVVVGWPKGYVREPSAQEKAWGFFKDNVAVAAAAVGALVVLGYYLLVWLAVGKDPARGVIVPLYAAPDNLSPAVVRFVQEMGYDDRGFSAAVLDMAVKGHLTITEQGGTYTLRKQPGGSTRLAPDEQKIDAQLFRSGGTVVLERKNHAVVAAAKNALKSALALAYEKSHFVSNRKAFVVGVVISAAAVIPALILSPGPDVVVFLGFWLSIWSIGVFFLAAIVVKLWTVVLVGSRGQGTRAGAFGAAVFMTLFALPFFTAEVFALGTLAQTAPVSAAQLALVGVLNVLFFHLLKAPTLLGRRVLDRIEGFKMFLAATEGDRLKRLYPAGRTPEVFEKFLPYAVALGVEQQWTAQFEDVLTAAAQPGSSGYQPGWYSGSAWSRSGAADFATSIGSSLGGAISSSSTAPGSRSGGGGGGSSGGGGGGGGGGGW